MSVHLADTVVGGLPPEPRLLNAVTIGLIAESERERFDHLIQTEHYLKNATVAGQVLRYVAEYEGRPTLRGRTQPLLFRSPAIFLFERQRPAKHAKQSLPDFEKSNHRRPGTLIARFMSD